MRGVEDVAPYGMLAHTTSVGAGAYDSPYVKQTQTKPSPAGKVSPIGDG